VEAVLEELEASLGHKFTRKSLIERALTHRSLAHELTIENPDEPTPAGDNERLEYLGDAVLGLAVAEALFLLHSDWQEGELTRVRAQLVSRQHMAEVAAKIRLGEYLRLSRGEEKSGLRRKGTVLSNSMEAVLGAVYLDGGLAPVKAFVDRYVMGADAEHLAREVQNGAALGNYKSALQEFLQAGKAGIPFYRVKGESGPDHRKKFLVEVRLKQNEDEPGRPLAKGSGRTKKLAEQDAARRALDRLQRDAAGQEPAPEGEVGDE